MPPFAINKDRIDPQISPMLKRKLSSSFSSGPFNVYDHTQTYGGSETDAGLFWSSNGRLECNQGANITYFASGSDFMFRSDQDTPSTNSRIKVFTNQITGTPIGVVAGWLDDDIWHEITSSLMPLRISRPGVGGSGIIDVTVQYRQSGAGQVLAAQHRAVWIWNR